MSKRDDRSNQEELLEKIEEPQKKLATLRANEGRLRILLDTVSDVVWYECQVSRGLDYANKALERVNGRPLSEFFDNGVRRFLQKPFRRSSLAQAVADALAD